MKVLVLTHTDLDGAGSRILAEAYFEPRHHELTVVHLENGKIDEWVTRKMQPTSKGEIPLAEFDYIYMTDISVGPEVAVLIDEALKADVLKEFVLLDHHKTAEFLNVYDWAHVHTHHDDGSLASGTSLFLHYLNDVWGPTKPEKNIIAEKIRRYDTWEWHTKYQDVEPKMLNDLFYIYGTERFVQHALSYIKGELTHLLNDEALSILDIENTRISTYYQQKRSTIEFGKFLKFSTATIFAETYQSQIGMMILNEFPDVDVVIMIDMSRRKISFRSSKPGIDVTELAVKLGGGGHPQAAGAPIPKGIVHNTMISILE